MDTSIIAPALNATVVTPSTELHFISIAELKKQLGIETIDIVKSPSTNKVFAATTAGNFKVQQNIDFTLALSFMYTQELSDGCIVNVKNTTIAVL